MEGQRKASLLGEVAARAVHFNQWCDKLWEIAAVLEGKEGVLAECCLVN